MPIIVTVAIVGLGIYLLNHKGIDAAIHRYRSRDSRASHPAGSRLVCGHCGTGLKWEDFFGDYVHDDHRNEIERALCPVTGGFATPVLQSAR